MNDKVKELEQRVERLEASKNYSQHNVTVAPFNTLVGPKVRIKTPKDSHT
jgi:hypothetical protein